MRELTTPNLIADRIRLLRDDPQKTIIIVEGYSDQKFYDNLVKSESCQFVVADGKVNAVSAIIMLNQDHFQGILAIVDADFDRLEQQNQSIPNLLLTDDHDLEMMIIKSPALEKLLKERGSEDKIRSFNNDNRTFLLEEGRKIGYLRWLSLRENLSLKFEDLTYSKFVDKKTLIIDMVKLINAVKNNSQQRQLDETVIESKIEVLEAISQDSWHICCGHDLISILSIALCKVWGTWNTKEVKSDILERELRLAYEKIFFTETNLYTLIQTWETKNKYYRVIE
jgi:hypothetical protein